MDEYSPQILENLQELHRLLMSEESLESTLQRVAELACVTIDGCDSAGVTILQDSKVSTAAATDDFTLKIDHDQYQNREGPCPQALSTQEVVKVDDIASDTRWPNFAEAAKRDGLGAAFPFLFRGATNRWGRSISTQRKRIPSVRTVNLWEVSSPVKRRWRSRMLRSTCRQFSSPNS